MASMFGTLNTPKATKFTDIRPGSVVEVHDRRSPQDSMQATVLQSMPEYGPSAIPALLVRPHGEDMEPSMLLFSNGNWVVTVVTDGSILQGEEPEGVITITPKQIERHGLRYTGGIEDAETVIRWAAGQAVITYHSGVSNDSEHLTVHTLEGEARVNAGDWVVRGGAGEFTVERNEQLLEHYDVSEPAVA